MGKNEVLYLPSILEPHSVACPMQSLNQAMSQRSTASLGIRPDYVSIHLLTISRFPGQEHVAGNSKIPSIMYYDRDGNMKAAGAEADGASVLAQAEDEQWVKTELYVCSISRHGLFGALSHPLDH